MEKIAEILNEFKTLDDEYFKEFVEHYPEPDIGIEKNEFCPHELYEKAIEVQALLTMLGETATDRMKYIGFDLLYSFDNPVDWYNWKENIKKRKVPHSIYFSIAVRMESEIKRMQQYIKKNSWDTYCALSESDFLVSKERYLVHFKDENMGKEPQGLSESLTSTEGVPHVYVENFHYDSGVEGEAVSTLGRLHKKSSILSNIVNIATKIGGA